MNGSTTTPMMERDYERQLREMNEALLVSSVRQHELTEQAEQAAAALRGSEERLAAELAATEALQEISIKMIQEGDVKALYEQILDAAIAVMRSNMASIQILDEGQDALRMLAFRGFDPEFGKIFELNGPDTRTSCSVARLVGHRVIVPDVETCDFIAGTPAMEDHRKTGIRAAQSTPLISRSGLLLGIISTHWRQPHQPSEHDLRLFDILARQAADLIERKQVEAERERLLEQEQRLRQTAEAHNRAKDEFLSVVSHELRGPLNSILGYTRLTRANPHNAELVARYAEIIERNAKTQQQMTEDLLDTARIISGKLKLEPAPADLRLVLEDALTVVQLAAEAKQIELAAPLGDEPVEIVGDAMRLQQVVWNLLQNAIKFTPAGGRVELRLERDDKQARIVVSDTGKGIGPEFLPHIFDRFSQSDMSQTRRHGGLGLGLALVKQLVELHGGTIEAASAGAGATFIVTLPLRAPQVAAQKPPRAIAEVVSGQEAIPFADLPRLDGVRVLVVDDQEEARLLVAAALGQQGAAVTAVASGAEALALLDRTTFDALILDIAMPDEDGYTVLKKVRALEAERDAEAGHIPAVALTAYGRSEDRLRALQAGFLLHVAKPVELPELVMVIASLTRNRQGDRTTKAKL
jgi:signal transduction histidine kinase/ActR/RegA family two-component response regulator